MIAFAWPWAALLFVLPLLVYRLLPPTSGEAALWTPRLERFLYLGLENGRQKKSRRRLTASICCWLLLVLAAMRPQWLGEPVDLAISGRDLILAVDLSVSMNTQDFTLNGQTVTRMDALKALAIPFIERRTGDRVGLILFGDQAYVQVPLTFDRAMVVQLLDEANTGLAGDRTAIGDAIGLALKRAGEKSERRVLILLTDGANTAGLMSPHQASRLAADKKLIIYPIGIGSRYMEVGGMFDEAPLAHVAQTTGGRYFRAYNSAELEDIYGLIDQLEPVEQEPEMYRPLTELYPWPLGMALAVAALLAVWELSLFRMIANVFRRQP
ncbi:MAG: BatB protein [Desulfobulbus propionicus]|nr:MAG: BatB protein [Desulfobulbus propionicus]